MFIETPANKQSLSMRKPVYGVGINDFDYIVFKKGPDGKGAHCPYYQRWKNMMERCFSKQYKKRYPTYADVSCCDDWIKSSEFKKWMITQNWKGMDLDKDILVSGNKIYSPDTCVFIPPDLNKLLNFNHAQRGKHGIGIREYKKKTGKYRAAIRLGSKTISLGSYESIELAQSAYISAKKDIIRNYAKEYSWIHPLIEDRLLEIAENLSVSAL